MPKVTAEVIIRVEIAGKKSTTMTEHKNRQAFFPGFGVCRVVDADGNLVAIRPRDSLIADARNWDFGFH